MISWQSFLLILIASVILIWLFQKPGNKRRLTEIERALGPIVEYAQSTSRHSAVEFAPDIQSSERSNVQLSAQPGLNIHAHSNIQTPIQYQDNIQTPIQSQNPIQIPNVQKTKIPPPPHSLRDFTSRLPANVSQGQKELCRALEEITGHEFQVNVRPDWLKWRTGYNLELDCYSPTLGLAAEYNGKQHYDGNHYFNKSPEAFFDLIERDRFKPVACDQNNVYLFTVPYSTPLDQIKNVAREQVGRKYILDDA